jgi:dipeptidyl aminopeptidase/acylaminoacyl peptidase
VLFVWQDSGRVIAQTSSGVVQTKVPSTYNTYPDYEVLSRDGRHIALPLLNKGEMDLYDIDLLHARSSALLGTKSGIYLVRFSPSGRFLRAVWRNGEWIVVDRTNGRYRSLGRDLRDLAWSPTKDVLFFRRDTGPVQAFDARTSRTWTPSPVEVDRSLGTAYRRAIAVKGDRYSLSDVSPSGAKCYVGRLAGGSQPYPIGGTYYDGIGQWEPYKFGIVGRDGKLCTFEAPKDLGACALYPLGWTRADQLLLSVEDHPNLVLLYDPTSGRTYSRKLVPPLPDATLLAVTWAGAETIRPLERPCPR